MNQYIGKRLDGRYEILELIGIGGMADVYLANDITTGRKVAVKILKEEYLTNEDFKRRFRNESKAIALLSHPNIVKIYDVSFGERVQFIVMEYVPGITLKEYIQQQGKVGWKETVHFTVQILRALQHAHDNGIVHRDVKPQNVMLLQDGTVKVMDFGIARFARENGRTISEKAIGSVHYISPEQARGEVADERSDIYSVGIVMYELLTGQLPFDGESPVAIALKQMQAEAKRPRELNPDIPEGLEEIVMRAMKKDPDLRYQSASEMLRDIDEFKRNPSVLFEYKYFTDEGTTRYFDAPNPDGEEEGKKKKGKKDKGKTKDGKKKKRMSTSMQILLAVTGACVLVAIVALIIFFTALNQPPGSFRLYNLVGQNYNEVLDNPAYDQVELEISSTEPSDEYDEGIIISQEPRANTSVRQGSVVRVVVSSGLRMYAVPDVAGRTQEQAEQELSNAGFVSTVVQQSDDTVPAGQVISTSPAANEEARKGSTVTIYLSTGSRNLSTLTTVPRVVGMTRSQAEQELANFDLSASFTEVDSTRPAGEVVSQSYEEGARVAEGTTVNLEVSSGNAPQQTVNCSVNVGDTSQYASRDYTVSVTVDGSSAGSFTFNPANSSSAGYDVSGRSSSSTVTFSIGGQVFARFTVNFQSGSVSNTSLNTDLLEEAEESSQGGSGTGSNTSSGTGSNTSSATSETED